MTTEAPALTGTITTHSGKSFALRPIHPDDGPLIDAMIAKTTLNDMRLRFFTPLHSLPPALSARLTHIDYDRHMALVALDPDASKPEIVGVVRLIADADRRTAEYAVIVRSDLKGQGLGWALMQRMLDYGRSRGFDTVWGHVLRENETMIRMARELGFSVETVPEDGTIVKVVASLREPQSAAS